jgi:bifunctional oligoribonuclease and PAP phosphatase NrnA
MISGEKVKAPPELLSFLKKEDNFLIATHINPDGDAIGSSLALTLALESLGKHVVVYERDAVPELYRFLPCHEKFIHSTCNLHTVTCNLVLLDCNTSGRAGIKDLQVKSSAVIDHHETENDFGDIKWVEPDAAATGLMIFYLLKELGVTVTREIAINLYTAIVVDTGAFRYSNTDPDVLRVAAELVEAGAHPAAISNNLYEMWPDRKFALLIMVLNTLEIKDTVAMTFVTNEMFRKTGTGAEDTEHFANFPRMMRDIKVSAFFREINNNEWKASLRSKGEINVAQIAVRFEGGGHKNAAGYTIKGSLEYAKEMLLKQILPESGD